MIMFMPFFGSWLAPEMIFYAVGKTLQYLNSFLGTETAELFIIPGENCRKVDAGGQSNQTDMKDYCDHELSATSLPTSSVNDENRDSEQFKRRRFI